MATMEVEPAAATVLAAPLLSSSAILKLLLFVVTLTYLGRALSRPRKTTTKCSSTTCASPGVGNPPLLPGPGPWPVVGNLPEMLLNKPAFRWIHQMMSKMGTDIACVKLGDVHVVSITCPEIAREVLRKQDANFISRPLTIASETLSGGYRNAVLSPYGDQWKKMRRVLTSEIICPSRDAWLHDKRTDEANNLTRYVYNLATRAASSGAGVVDVRHVARQSSLLRQRRAVGLGLAKVAPVEC